VADYATEEEQLEALKRWWRENGRSVVLGAAVGILALAGWRGWEMYQEQQALSASAIHDRMNSAGDYETVAEHADRLRSEYGGTPYAVLGAMHAAGRAVDAERPHEALEWLRWARENATDPAIAALARLRSAWLLFDQGEMDRALGLLEAEVPTAYTGLYAALRGHILNERGDLEGALTAYQRALDAEIGPADRALIERRINRLRGRVATAPDDGAADSDS